LGKSKIINKKIKHCIIPQIYIQKERRKEFLLDQTRKKNEQAEV
jgi:hypothetical protein